MYGFRRTRQTSMTWLRRLGISAGIVAAVTTELTLSLADGAGTAYAATKTATNPVTTTNALLASLAQNGSFNGSVLVAQRGKILLDKGYGSANIMTNTPDTPQTRYAIGSLTQGFVAVAVMQLVDAGKVKLDAPISNYIQSQNPTTQTITVRELLTQTSGAPATPTAPATQPGTHYTYSPLNYLLLGQIVANVSGESCETYIGQNILTPLGLTNTGFISGDSSTVQGAATGYDYNGSVVTAVNYTPGQLIDAIGMYSTTEDLFKWDQALYTGKLVPLSDIKQIFTADPIALASLGNLGYGFGWTVTPDNAVTAEMSLDYGFQSFFDRDLQNDTTVIVLSNDDFSPMKQIEAQLEFIVSNAPLPPVANTSAKVGGMKHIIVNRRHLPNVDSRSAGSTVYLPLTSVGRVFDAVKVTQKWNGSTRVLSLTTSRPLLGPLDSQSLGTGNTDVYVNGQLVMRINTYTWQDPSTKRHSVIPYASISDITLILHSLGLKTSWHGATWSIRG